jgi:predicted transcriptional regulator
MPSKRKQINIRLDDESKSRLARLVESMRRDATRLGVSKLSQSDVIRAALIELEARYAGPKKAKILRNGA